MFESADGRRTDFGVERQVKAGLAWLCESCDEKGSGETSEQLY